VRIELLSTRFSKLKTSAGCPAITRHNVVKGTVIQTQNGSEPFSSQHPHKTASSVKQRAITQGKETGPSN
jgi:hypothetical protein